MTSLRWWIRAWNAHKRHCSGAPVLVAINSYILSAARALKGPSAANSIYCWARELCSKAMRYWQLNNTTPLSLETCWFNRDMLIILFTSCWKEMPQDATGQVKTAPWGWLFLRGNIVAFYNFSVESHIDGKNVFFSVDLKRISFGNVTCLCHFNTQ